MQADSMAKPPKKSTAKSRVTNGTKLGADIDGRSVWARRLRDLIALYSADLADDPATLPNSTGSLIRRAATLTVELERAESLFADAGKADADALNAYQTTANSLRRLLDGLGLSGKANVRFIQPAPGSDDLEDGRFITDAFPNISKQDLGIIYGADTLRSKYDLPRRIMHMIQEAKKNGTALAPAIAEIAVDVGLASYADQIEGEASPANDNPYLNSSIL